MRLMELTIRTGATRKPVPELSVLQKGEHPKMGCHNVGGSFCPLKRQYRFSIRTQDNECAPNAWNLQKNSKANGAQSSHCEPYKALRLNYICMLQIHVMWPANDASAGCPLQKDCRGHATTAQTYNKFTWPSTLLSQTQQPAPSPQKR